MEQLEKLCRKLVTQGLLSHLVADFLLNCGVVTELVTVAMEIVLGLGGVRMAGIVWTGGIITRYVESLFSF